MVDNLYGKALNDRIKEIFLRLLPKQDGLLNDQLLKKYLDKWLKKTNQKRQKENEAATKIQSLMRGNSLRKLFNNEQLRKKLLDKLIQKLLKASDPLIHLQVALAKWRKNAGKITCHENARIIQMQELSKNSVNKFVINY